jgi:two-component system, LytTR family, response regulator
MIKSILVDDEIHCLNSLGILLNEYCPEIEVMNKYLSGKDALDAVDEIKPELVFLDIEMPSMNGFDLLEKCKPISFSVIFTTSYDQYAIKAIRFSALDYLLKPIDPKELVAAVKRVGEQHTPPSAEQFQMLIDQIQYKDRGFAKIAIPTAQCVELILADQVVRCEAYNNYTHIFCKNRPKIVACRTLKEIEEQFRDFAFFLRVHQSYLVNLNEVTKYIRGEAGYLIMSDGSTVNVSRSRKDTLLKLF